MHSISVKKLRKSFPIIRSELKKGESFLLIYKSKPIAQLTPLADLHLLEEATETEVEEAAIRDINKDLEDDFLTKEEVEYYLSSK